MNRLLLETFKSVVDEGGVLNAASALGCAQSNVTARLKQLEQTLDVPLFDRKGKRLQLNEAGKRYLPYAVRILDLIEEAALSARTEGPAYRRIRVGTMESSAAMHIPAALAGLRKTYPDLDLKLEVGAEPALSDMLVQHRIDLAVTARVVERPGLQYLPGFEEPLVVVAREQPCKQLVRASTQSLTLLAFVEGCPYRSIAQRWLEGRGVACEQVLSFGTFGAILGCAAAGMGVAVVPRRLVEGLLEAAGLHSYSPRDLPAATSYFVLRAGEQAGTEARALMKQLQKVAQRPATAV